MEGLPAAKKAKRQLPLPSTAIVPQPRLSPAPGMFKLKPQHQQQHQHQHHQHQQHQQQVYYLFQPQQHSHVVVNGAQQQPRLVHRPQQLAMMQPQAKKVPSPLPPVQFYQQQPMSQQHQQQVLHQRLTQAQATASPRVHPKRLEDLALPSDEIQQASNPATAAAASPWPTMLPLSLTMPLHAAPPMPAGHSVAYPSTAMRRMGAKRVPGPDDWRLSPRAGMNSVKFISTSAAQGSPGFSSSPPGSFPLPPRLSSPPATVLSPRSSPVPARSPHTVAHRGEEAEQQAARAAAIEKRRAKIRRVAAFYQAECEASCRRLLVLQQQLDEDLRVNSVPDVEVADKCIKHETGD